MKVNLKKIGAIVAGATILASSAAFAGLMFGSTTLVDDNGAPVAKVVLGSQAQPSDGVAAALIAGKIASSAYATSVLTAEYMGEATCSGTGSGACAISNEKAKLEITVPGTVAAGTYTIENLIGDYVDRTLEDRLAHDSTADTEYVQGGSDTADNANPFTDGYSTNLGDARYYMYKVGGSQFSPFADVTLTDDDSGDTYTEMQYLWVEGDNHFSTQEDEIVGDLDSVVYSVKFDGPGSDEVGIPVCTDAVSSNYSACLDDADLDGATETHKLKIHFLGEEWIISDMTPPTGALVNQTALLEGGSISLAKESVSGIINQGESLPAGDYTFVLDDLEAHADTTKAIISVLDANGEVVDQDTIPEATTREYTLGGETYRLHVYKVAPGYTFGAKWADIAIYSQELVLTSGDELDKDENSNEGWEVLLGWKNLDASASATTPDALRTIIVYTTDFDATSSSEDSILLEGDYVSLVTSPTSWKLTYQGLDLTSDDYETLKFVLVSDDKTLSASKMIDDEACVIEAPYLKVTSSDSSDVFELGNMADNEFYVALVNATGCDGSAGYYGAGSVIMKVSSDQYDIENYTVADANGLTVGYSELGDGDTSFTSGGGAIRIESYASVLNGLNGSAAGEDGIGELFQTMNSDADAAIESTVGDFYFAIAEKADVNDDYVNYWVFGVGDIDASAPNTATFDFDSQLNVSDDQVTSDAQEVLYGHATANGASFYNETLLASGPVTAGMELVDEGYVGERGSMFVTLDSDEIVFNMAHKLARAQWYLAGVDAESSSSSATIVTLGEGQSTTVNGVTVKVLEITETVGACGAGGGSVACTPDMTEVSAVIMPNNAPSVTVAMPYSGSYGNLVVLDSDAVGINTLISVGGDKVNTVTAELLQGSAVDWTTEKKVVREVVQGSKIVVAGASAVDTLEAAQDFVAQLE